MGGRSNSKKGLADRKSGARKGYDAQGLYFMVCVYAHADVFSFVCVCMRVCMGIAEV